MPSSAERLRQIRTFPQLVKYLSEDLGWPIEQGNFDDLIFEWDAVELGIDPRNAAKIEEIKQLRPLGAGQSWGIFFLKFAPKHLPIVVLRRILGQLVVHKRASAGKASQRTWAARDLLFISAHGEGGDRELTFAHFSDPSSDTDLPTLRVLGWDEKNTNRKLDYVAELLRERLSWPEHPENDQAWRETWASAFELRPREVIRTSQELSIRLAELARIIRDRIKAAIKIETDKGPLTKLMKSFRQALIHDLEPAGFADMYAQTIAYGLLSARIADPHRKTRDDLASHMRTNPFLRELMEAFLKVGGRSGKVGGPDIDFDELGVREIVELLDDPNTHIEAVVRDFDDRNPQEDPVIHFYELFLKEYDELQKISRGVFYTPRAVVSYIVRSVHELLRSEFGLEDGLADAVTWREMVEGHTELKIPEGVPPEQDFVQILDPATGTGTFLVEVIDIIYQTMVTKWKSQGHTEKKIEALWNEYVPKHLLSRLHGYELLMAPYAIAHLKIGLKLYETGYRFGSDERARIYLTNTLEPASDTRKQTEFNEWIPALAHEAQAVNEIKRTHRFTVVVGNPPYSGISSNMSEHAQHLVDAYKTVDGGALNERKLWLQDDYVKFIRFAQSTIAQAHSGIVGYITNHGYLDNPTFRGMRQSLMGTFQSLRLLNLHGNANKKEQAPDGSVDKNIFDIRQGVAVYLGTHFRVNASVEYADLWGSRDSKYDWLGKHDVRSSGLVGLSPDSPYYFFEPQNTDNRVEYESGWQVNVMFPVNSAGFITARDHFVVDLKEETLLERIGDFSNLKLSDAHIRAKYFAGCGSAKYPDGDTRGWKLPAARRHVANDSKWRDRVRMCLYRPFDIRAIYWAEWMVDWPRPQVMQHMFAKGAIALGTSRSVEIGTFKHVLCTRLPLGHHTVSLKEVNYLFPLYLTPDSEVTKPNLMPRSEREPNLAPSFVGALSVALGVSRGGAHGLPDGVTAEDIFQYTYAVFHSPGYRGRYGEFLKIDFPRVLLPGSIHLFRDLARLGGQLIALHLLESNQLDHSVSMYIGHTNPEVSRVGWSNDTVWLDAEAARKGAPAMPGTIGFRGVSEAVWNFQIGGYQVCEKWLKDRKGHTLSKEDITHYQKIVLALAETICLMNEVDEVIEEHGGWPAAFQVAGVSLGAEKTRGTSTPDGGGKRYEPIVPPIGKVAERRIVPQGNEDDGGDDAEDDQAPAELADG